jgi:predicted GNAT superfamily acetyltransferase
MARIRPARRDDLPRLRQLNEGAVPHVNSVTLQDFEDFLAMAALFLVAEEEKAEEEEAPKEQASDEGGEILAFLLVLAPEAPYQSPNFLWFRQAYEDFLYVDRIVVAPQARGRGLGSQLYRQLLAWATSRTRRITCEVNLRPANEGSLLFHQRWGFRAVGRQQTEGGTKEVSLMVLDLP